jgi:hypothetical protein
MSESAIEQLERADRELASALRDAERRIDQEHANEQRESLYATPSGLPAIRR